MAEESIDLLVTPAKDGLDTGSKSKNHAGTPDSMSNGRPTPFRHRRASMGSCHAGDHSLSNSAEKPDSMSNGRPNLAPHRRASIGSYHAGGRSLRNSVEKSVSADSSQNVVPHYLRASTGSCHEFCKYGRDHSFEKKERKPSRKRIAKTLPNELYSVQVLVSDGQKEADKVANYGPSTDKKNHSPDQKPSPDAKSLSPKSQTSLDEDNAFKPKTSKDTKNQTPDLPSKSFQKPKVPCKTYSPKVNSFSGNKTVLPKSKSSFAKQFPSADHPEIVKSVIFPSTEVEDLVKQVISTDELSKAERNTTDVFQKHPTLVKSKPVNGKPSSSSHSADGVSEKWRRNSNAKTGKILAMSKAPSEKVLVGPAATVSPRRVDKMAHINSGKAGNLKLASSVKDRNRIRRVKTEESNDEKVSEKTLHVIETETENVVSESVSAERAISSRPSPSSTGSLSCSNSSSLSQEEDNADAGRSGGRGDEVISAGTEQSGGRGDEFIYAETEQSGGRTEKAISDNSDSKEIDIVPPVTENQSKTLRKSRTVVSEDSRSPVKLKFRSGKVVDLPLDNNTPRRLRFRRARVLGAEDDKGKLVRTLKTAGVNDGTSGTKVKVVLKAPDLQGKKDAQVVSEDSRSSVKLKFRSGKVVGLRSDNDTLRRLRFRRLRVLGTEDPKGNSRRTSKLAGVNDDASGGKASSEEVVLKHHDVQGKKDAQVVSEDSRPPVKLKFASGKVVDLQSNNNTPRRLRFRGRKVLGAEDGKGNSRILKKVGVHGDTSGAKVSSEKVVLKHEDVQGTKDARGLLNNMIEETASKLVKSRKSKVKALVGAFETVISLQEGRPSR